MAGPKRLSDWKKESEYVSSSLSAIRQTRAEAAIENLKKDSRIQFFSKNQQEDSIAQILTATVEVCTNPVNMYIDTLRARRMSMTKVHEITKTIYNQYIDPENAKLPQDEQKTYEEMIPVVADYVLVHQEIYNTVCS